MFQVLSPKYNKDAYVATCFGGDARDLRLGLLEVSPCNRSRQDHGSWDFPLHTGLQVLSPKCDKDAYVATCFGGDA